MVPFLAAVVIAVISTLLVSVGVERERDRSAILVFFLMLFLPLWGLAVWMPPVGPLYYGIAWLQMIVWATLIVLFMAAVMPPRYYRRRKLNVLTAAEQREWARGVGVFFWFFGLVTLTLIVIGYIYSDAFVAH